MIASYNITKFSRLLFFFLYGYSPAFIFIHTFMCLTIFLLYSNYRWLNNKFQEDSFWKIYGALNRVKRIMSFSIGRFLTFSSILEMHVLEKEANYTVLSSQKTHFSAMRRMFFLAKMFFANGKLMSLIYLVFFFFVYVFFFNLSLFNWRLITLQYCIHFSTLFLIQIKIGTQNFKLHC